MNAVVLANLNRQRAFLVAKHWYVKKTVLTPEQVAKLETFVGIWRDPINTGLINRQLKEMPHYSSVVDGENVVAAATSQKDVLAAYLLACQDYFLPKSSSSPAGLELLELLNSAGWDLNNSLIFTSSELNLRYKSL